MGLVLGVNCGFVTTAPTADPNDIDTKADTTARAIKDTAPVSVNVVTEIGWWADNATQETNYEVAIYTDEGNDEPEDIVAVSRTNAKGTSSGWIRATGLSIPITAETTYWIAIQVDDTATQTQTDVKLSGGFIAQRVLFSTLPNPWGTSSSKLTWLTSIYAKVETPGFTRKIKISGTFQDKPIKTKVGGTFVDKLIKIKVGGTFQDA